MRAGLSHRGAVLALYALEAAFVVLGCGVLLGQRNWFYVAVGLGIAAAVGSPTRPAGLPWPLRPAARGAAAHEPRTRAPQPYPGPGARAHAGHHHRRRGLRRSPASGERGLPSGPRNAPTRFATPGAGPRAHGSRAQAARAGPPPAHSPAPSARPRNSPVTHVHTSHSRWTARTAAGSSGHFAKRHTDCGQRGRGSSASSRAAHGEGGVQRRGRPRCLSARPSTARPRLVRQSSGFTMQFRSGPVGRQAVR